MRLALVLLAALLLGAPLALAQWTPLRTDGALRPDVRGAWQARGYGWVLDLSADDLVAYDLTPAGCIRNDETGGELADWIRVARRDSTTLRLSHRPENSTQYVFDALAAVPAACATPPGDGPRETFGYLWTFMDQHYAFFELHGVDWHARYAALAPTVTDATTEAELAQAVSRLIEGLDDGHLNLMVRVDGAWDRLGGKPPRRLNAALQAAFEAQDAEPSRRAFTSAWVDRNRARLETELLDAPMQASPNGRVRWGHAGSVGYVAINGMEDFAEGDDVTLADDLAAVDAILSRVVRELADTDALILDVAFNQGGYDEVALAVAAHFAGAPTVALTKQARGSAEVQALSVVPADVRYLKPVVVLTSDATNSAAEVFTMAMRALPTVTHAGAATRGALSDVLIGVLPNGWMMTLSNEVYLDADGALWEGRGIEPELAFPVFDDGDLGGHVEAVTALVARLRR